MCLISRSFFELDDCIIYLARCIFSPSVLVAIYISSDQNMDDILHFLRRALLPYTTVGGAFLGRGEDKLPMILSGDFNVNFASEDSSPIIKFFNEDLNLTINNNPTTSTTRHGTTIDAVFTRYLEEVNSKTFISYFSYHKPIVTFVPLQE